MSLLQSPEHGKNNIVICHQDFALSQSSKRPSISAVKKGLDGKSFFLGTLVGAFALCGVGIVASFMFLPKSALSIVGGWASDAVEALRSSLRGNDSSVEYIGVIAEQRGAPGSREIVLEGDDKITTPTTFRPPVEITIRAKTDFTNLRMSYAADQVIFNWEGNPTQLRVDGGPAHGKHKADVGRIPLDKYVTIKWLVTPEEQSISVDNELRYEHKGDYSKIDKPVVIFPAAHSRVTVKSLKVRKLSEP